MTNTKEGEDEDPDFPSAKEEYGDNYNTNWEDHDKVDDLALPFIMGAKPSIFIATKTDAVFLVNERKDDEAF